MNKRTPPHAPLDPHPLPAFEPPAPPPPGAEARHTLEQNGTLLALSPQQQTAVELLAQGTSILATAQAAGIGRSTLYRWLNNDANFQAAYNEWRHDLQETVRARLTLIAESAARTVQQAVENGNVNAALAVLKGLGLLAPARPGSTDAEDIRQEMEMQRKEAEVRRKVKKAKMSQASFEADLEERPGF